jgi:hypothetical protein
MLLVAINGATLKTLFPKGVAPGSTVGAGLFPALSGGGGCQVKWNLGHQPFRIQPAGFRPWAFAATQGKRNLGAQDSGACLVPPPPTNAQLSILHSFQIHRTAWMGGCALIKRT